MSKQFCSNVEYLNEFQLIAVFECGLKAVQSERFRVSRAKDKNQSKETDVKSWIESR